MPTPRVTLGLAAAAALALAISCNSQDTTQPSPPYGASAGPTASATATAGAAGARSDLPVFDPGKFVRGVDNPLFPLPLGRRLISRGLDDGEPTTVVTDVTRDHKTILGVPVVVVLDRVFVKGVLTERTFDWYAQDTHGNVWYFGEDTKEFEDGRVVSTAGSFEAGKDGAKAGVIMRAHPKVGQVTPQESAPGVAEDKARVVARNVTVTVPAGTFHRCIKTAEFTPLEPDVLENKWYCPGVGITRERDVRGGTVSTALVRIVQR
jgi:hypothetical protein